MENRVYNIAWCDDKVDSLIAEHKDALREHNCVVCKAAKNAEDLISFLRSSGDQVDGVIVDFNVNVKKDAPANEREISGFSLIRNKQDEFVSIPFYLFSAHSVHEILSTYVDYGYDTEDDYFMGGDNFQRYFTVGQFNQLLSALCDEIERSHTPFFDLRQKYSKAFHAFDHFKLDTHSLLTILSSTDDSVIGTEIAKEINSMRRQIEKIYCTIFVDSGIFPNDVPLNQIPRTLAGGNKSYPMKEDMENCQMKPALKEYFEFFLQFTQDGSHEKSGLKFNINNYIAEHRAIHMALCLAHISMEIAIWSEEFEKKVGGIFPFIKVTDEIDTQCDIQIEGNSKFVIIDEKKCFVFDDRNTPLKEHETIIVKNLTQNSSENKWFTERFPFVIPFKDWTRKK